MAKNLRIKSMNNSVFVMIDGFINTNVGWNQSKPTRKMPYSESEFYT